MRNSFRLLDAIALKYGPERVRECRRARASRPGRRVFSAFNAMEIIVVVNLRRQGCIDSLSHDRRALVISGMDRIGVKTAFVH